jgi:hypothetical protein
MTVTVTPERKLRVCLLPSFVTLSAAKGLARRAEQMLRFAQSDRAVLPAEGSEALLWQGERVHAIVTGGSRSIGTSRCLGYFVHLHYRAPTGR